MRPSLFLFLALASTAAAATAAKCDNSTLPTTVATLEKPGQVPVAWLFAEGVRLYDCTSGTPSLSSGGFVNVSGGPGPGGAAAQASKESVWTGTGVYPDATGNGTFILTDSTDGSTFNMTVNYQVSPSPFQLT